MLCIRPGKRNDNSFWEKVCEIYNTANPDAPIDCDELKAAFEAAREEMRPEGFPNRGEIDPEAMKAAMQERLEALLADGKINDEQYAEMKERLESMPDDMPRFGFRGHGGFRGFGRPCTPPPAE